MGHSPSWGGLVIVVLMVLGLKLIEWAIRNHQLNENGEIDRTVITRVNVGGFSNDVTFKVYFKNGKEELITVSENSGEYTRRKSYSVN